MNKPRLWLQLFERQAGHGLGRREQLCAGLRDAMRRGELSLDERLPASRVLATDLGLSRVTVEAAYVQLEAEGYLRRKVGQGSFVAIAAGPLKPSKQTPLQPADLRPRLSARGQRISAGGGCDDPRRPLAFAAGSPDLRAFPVALWRSLLAKRLSGRRPDSLALLGYGDPQGLEELRLAIAGYLRQSRGLRCEPEQVMVLTSSQQALQLLASMLLDEGEPVWMEDPGYRGAATAFAAAGAAVVPIPVDDQGMCIEPLDRPAPRAIYLTPSHQYPSGVALSLARRLQLLALAEREQAWIIEDDYDSEFHYEGRPMPAMQGLDEHGRVIYLGTFSKALFPSLRLAYMVLPTNLVKPLSSARSIGDGHSSQLAQAVTADFISQGHFAAHLRLMRQLYRQRRDLLLEQAQTHLSAWLRPQASPGGLQIAALLPGGEEARFSRAATALGVATPSLSALYRDKAAGGGHDGWLLGYAALTPMEIQSAVAQLAKI
ncbi:MocR-like pyridoxine biosynthesis transcription factor PdxR [Roseateles oligotrophus]|uniref:PLP-dependent aminotransferase family protein n=1 Tax=Roseateles oligotrophus TaxID=1769250 RepID=A0ABT2YI70_9BURK|nr:PLP-dependent aminotransferase family protein [Roseateles oligotrophus]MCV2369746.1 PLP-dependent aminotransferase family protein [Roseateles oligotrophus]